jgi:hypothetical protein
VEDASLTRLKSTFETPSPSNVPQLLSKPSPLMPVDPKVQVEAELDVPSGSVPRSRKSSSLSSLSSLLSVMPESDGGKAAEKSVVVVPIERGVVEPQSSTSDLMAVDEIQQGDGSDGESELSDLMSVDDDVADSAGSQKAFRVVKEVEVAKGDKSNEVPFETDLSAQINAGFEPRRSSRLNPSKKKTYPFGYMVATKRPSRRKVAPEFLPVGTPIFFIDKTLIICFQD